MQIQFEIATVASIIIVITSYSYSVSIGYSSLMVFLTVNSVGIFIMSTIKHSPNLSIHPL